MDHHPRDAEDYSGLPGEHVTVDQIVAMNLRHWRIAANLKQHELGERAGISKANMSALERSADGERNPRRFDAQTLATLGIVLGVPLAAFFLPPPDDGISKRYLFHAAGDCHDMAALVSYLISDPPAPDDVALAAQYAERYFAAIRRYTELDPDEPDGWIGNMASIQRRREAIDRIRTQRAALAGVIEDLDRRAEAIADAGGLTDNDDGGPQ
jgi:transcriptional regulator with XRE-family HTH domain